MGDYKQSLKDGTSQYAIKYPAVNKSTNKILTSGLIAVY